MKKFKLDFDGEKFNTLIFDDNIANPDSSLCEKDAFSSYKEDEINKELSSLNKNLIPFCNLENGTNSSLCVKICKNCGKFFILTRKEFMWFKRNYLMVPGNCRNCREEKKINKDTKENIDCKQYFTFNSSIGSSVLWFNNGNLRGCELVNYDNLTDFIHNLESEGYKNSFFLPLAEFKFNKIKEKFDEAKINLEKAQLNPLKIDESQYERIFKILNIDLNK